MRGDEACATAGFVPWKVGLRGVFAILVYECTEVVCPYGYPYIVERPKSFRGKSSSDFFVEITEVLFGGRRLLGVGRHTLEGVLHARPRVLNDGDG